jgi:SAM-dependent methyltransferase/uncharacterized protein YbaR (Trm112 family)
MTKTKQGWPKTFSSILEHHQAGDVMKMMEQTRLECPICRGTLPPPEHQSEEWKHSLIPCSRCNLQYEVKQGVPIVWLSDGECVSRWGHIYKDFILNEQTLANWRHLESDPQQEGFWWQMMDRRKHLAKLITIPAAVSASLIVLTMLFGLCPVRVGFCLFIVPWAAAAWSALRYWSAETRHLYACRENYFRTSARRLAELQAQDRLSERRHFGGGEEAFSAWTGEISGEPSPERTDESYRKEHEQRAFVSRKAEFLGQRLAGVVSDEEMARWKVLCLGCGGPTHQEVNRFFQAKGCDLLGVDTQDFNTLAFRKLFEADSILANAMRLPLADDLFDAVVFTDVLEHLHDPLAGLKEIQRVLRPGGLLVLTTNNRHHHRHAKNPLLLTIMFLGQWFPDWLPRRDIHQEWDGKVFHHTEFARRELRELLEMAGFRRYRIRSINIVSEEKEARCLGPWLASHLGLGEEFFVLAWKESFPHGCT